MQINLLVAHFAFHVCLLGLGERQVLEKGNIAALMVLRFLLNAVVCGSGIGWYL